MAVVLKGKNHHRDYTLHQRRKEVKENISLQKLKHAWDIKFNVILKIQNSCTTFRTNSVNLQNFIHSKPDQRRWPCYFNKIYSIH